jgi:hypothetical protein
MPEHTIICQLIATPAKSDLVSTIDIAGSLKYLLLSMRF